MGWLAEQRKALELLTDIVKIKWVWWNWKHQGLDLENPRTFNEKIQWTKIYWRDERMRICADKLRVREYVAAKAGPGILNELYGVWDRAEDIDFDALPDSFVLKATHHSGGNVLCPDKRALDRPAAIRFLNRCLRQDIYRSGREWCYKDLPRRIVAERYLEEDGKTPADYKIFCFNGEPLFMALHTDRFTDHQRGYFDFEWNPMPFTVALDKPFVRPPAKPARLDAMAQIARQLSADFPFVRVDLYHIDDRIWFGEMTFYPGGGRLPFSSGADDEYWGDRLRLPGQGSCGGKDG